MLLKGVNKLSFLLALLCACCGFVVTARAQEFSIKDGARLRPITPMREQPKLELTTSVLEAKYCRDGDLRLRLRLNFVNVSGEALILHRYSPAVHLAYVSDSAEKALKREYRSKTHYSAKSIRLASWPDDPTPGDEFVTIRPGASYDTETDLRLWLSESEKEASDDVPPGDYLLEVRLETWADSSEKAEEFRQRWSQHGYLWSAELKSKPMPLKISPPPTPPSDCR